MNLKPLHLLPIVVAVALAGALAGTMLWERFASPPPPPAAPSLQLGVWQPTAERGPPIALAFRDAQGSARGLEELRGKVVLVNLWATWCAPCIKEMPALDRLQAKLGGEAFEVLAIAVDRQGESVVRPFFEKLGLASLALYMDPSNAASRVLAAPALPVSVLVDREGREIGRVLGAAEWDEPRFERLVRAAIDAPRG
jgi:thiol-disulfide isomerase/thioredoxin